MCVKRRSVMNCPMCSSRWKVVNTTNGENSGFRQYLAKPVDPLVRWYVQDDYTARQRRCPSCGHTKITVEIEAEDLRKMFTHIAEEGLPKEVKPKPDN